MRYAVYDTETAELLTVIKLEREWAATVKEHGTLRLAVTPGPPRTWTLDDKPITPRVYYVTLTAHEIASASGASTLFFFADMGEAALLLKPTMTPGQQDLLREAFENGIGEGVKRALSLRR